MPYTGIKVCADEYLYVNKSELVRTREWLAGLQKAGVKIDLERVSRIIREKLKAAGIESDPLVKLDEPLLTLEEQYGVAVYILDKISRRGIFIESNPTANLLLNYFNQMKTIL